MSEKEAERVIIVGNIYKDSKIYFNHCSYENVRPHSFNMELHTHDVCELLFLKRGNPKYLVEGKSYKMSKNFLIISRPGDRHCISFDEYGPYERYNLLYDEKTLPFDLYSKIPTKLDIINFDGNSVVCDLFTKSDYYFEHFKGDMLGKLLVSITEEIFFNIAIAIEENGDAGYCNSSENHFVAAALAYIEENLTSNITIDMICDEIYITKSHLHHLFMEHLHTSPKKYILAKRLNLAKRSIRSGKKPIEACMQSGFSDYSTFYRDYKVFFGYCPSKELEFEQEICIARENALKKYYLTNL